MTWGDICLCKHSTENASAACNELLSIRDEKLLELFPHFVSMHFIGVLCDYYIQSPTKSNAQLCSEKKELCHKIFYK